MSYITIVDATTYFASKLDAELWAAETPERQQQALDTAMRSIDLLAYKGKKTYPDLVNQFPRNESTTVPEAIQLANAELAYSLLDGIDPNIEYENLTMTSQAYANVRSSYDRSDLPEHIVAGVPNIEAWRYLSPYLANSREVKMARVS